MSSVSISSAAGKVAANEKYKRLVEALPADGSSTSFMKAVLAVRKVNNNFDSVSETHKIADELRREGVVEYQGTRQWGRGSENDGPDTIKLTAEGVAIRKG